MSVRLFLGLAAVLVLGGGASRGVAQDVEPDLRTTAFVDLPRFMGKWWVISHVPNFLEKGKVATSDTYSQDSRDRIQTLFTFRDGSVESPEDSWPGNARVVNTTTNADWTVQLIWPFRSRYLILDIDPNYGWVVVSNGSGKLVWVMSRTRRLDPYTYKIIEEHLRQRRFNPELLAMVPQANN